MRTSGNRTETAIDQRGDAEEGRTRRHWFAWVAAMVMLATSPARAADPDALWKIVGGQCVPNQQLHGDPAPCALVDLASGTAVLKDIRGNTQYLLLPTAKISGIESPEILAANAPNYFQAAWEARRFFEAKVGHPVARDDIGLAINSAHGRSQNQLHIHIDCVLPAVKRGLQAVAAQIGDHWAPLDAAIGGHRYKAMRIVGADLSTVNPFKLLADGDQEAKADMGRETLAAIGATFADGKPGFYLLSDHADVLSMNTASSENLLDHDCAVLKPAAQ